MMIKKEEFVTRNVGPRENEIPEMLNKIGVESIDELIDQVIPRHIRLKNDLNISEAITEQEYLAKIRRIALKNKVFRSYIGMGYYGTGVPSVILRNIFENPGWYTSYTPYQAEISQGRLEALLNFQTVITELTGMEIANCSLLDEGTAAAEAMNMMYSLRTRDAVKAGKNKLFVDNDIFISSLEVIQLRAEPIGIEVICGDYNNFEFDDMFFGAIVQYPAASGKINDYSEFTKKAHSKEILVTAVTDIMALTLLTPPAEWGADIAVGSTQRFGIPMGYGGPHAAYLATNDKYKRSVPGRIIGITVDRYGNNALRMALQTREQHIKREKATSNICTAQALLATMAGMYAVYHGSGGLKRIAKNINNSAKFIAEELTKYGYNIKNKNFFDTIIIELPDGVTSENIKSEALKNEVNFNYINKNTVGLSTDELVNLCEVNIILNIFADAIGKEFKVIESVEKEYKIDDKFSRKSDYLQQQVFNSYHSETEMMRYIKKLERRDIALNHSMISLGSCTMKLNPATTMLPLSWPEFNNIHPFVPEEQVIGYKEMIDELEKDLAEITGLDSVSLQPNSGASGEHAGLMVIRAFQKSKGEGHRNICLIPSSAHGTNPASAVMAGLEVVIVKCDENGNIDVDDLDEKAKTHKDNLSSVMITYPSTHGVFESRICEIAEIIHANGGQVYLDGANMNAQVGFTNPGITNADVCHLNLHKTFAIPHGGGGPGIGPIVVAKHLAEFLPKHPLVNVGGKNGIKPVADAPYGSAMILPITYAYIKMSGAKGLKKATEMAILNANYVAENLKGYYEVLYTGETGRCAHEMILNCQKFREKYGITVADIAKRLADYGYHAPTLAFPVAETLMMEPTESESKQELDRFIDAMKSIKAELDEIAEGKADKNDNVLINAPHTLIECTANEWTHPYSREKAAFPAKWVKENKFWPYVGRVDNAHGDRNLICTCDTLET